MADETRPIDLARAGDVQALLERNPDDDATGDRETYKWLCVAEDFGHDVDGEAYETLVRGLTGDPYRAVVWRVERLRRLREIGSVPVVVIRGEAERLMEAVMVLLGEDAPKS